MTCTSQAFKVFLGSMVYQIGTSQPIRGAKYVETLQYILAFERKEVSADMPQLWSKMLASGGPLEMFLFLDRPEQFPERCPRCNALLPNKLVNTLKWSVKHALDNENFLTCLLATT